MAAPEWRGCHGVRLHGGEALDLGHASGEPLLDAHVIDEGAIAGDGRELWRRTEMVDTATGPVLAEQWLSVRADGGYLLRTNRGAALDVDPTSSRITVAGADPGTRSQLLAAYALPLLLHRAPAVVVHGSACARDGHAVVVVGPSGAGKSSILVRLIEAGWSPITEDLCTIDLRAAPAAWPGPPWVRRLRDEAGPAGAAIRFATADKVVWDIASDQVRSAQSIAALVALSEPGGTESTTTALAPRDAVAVVAEHAVWLAEAGNGAAALFSPLATLTAKVSTVRVTLPRTSSWLDAVPSIFDAVLARAMDA